VTQLTLPMLTLYEGPRLVGHDAIAAATSYRDAVRQCWDQRTRKNLPKTLLACEAGLYASHVTDYLSSNDTRRELPAKHIAAFEVSCGNRAISQWLAAQAHLTILETFIQQRQA
jgi:hypothetical protein